MMNDSENLQLESSQQDIDSDDLNELLQRAKDAVRKKSSRNGAHDSLAAQDSLIVFEASDDEIKAEAVSASDRHKRQKRTLEKVSKPVDIVKLSSSARQSTATIAVQSEGSLNKVPMDKWGQLPPKRKTKKEFKATQSHNAGPQWFNMPAQTVTPELRREVQAMRLHAVLDPKRFLKGEARRERSRMPEFFQLGHVLNTPHPATTSASAGASTRKRNFLDELVDDSEARTRARQQFAEVQKRGASGGRRFLRDKMAARRGRGGSFYSSGSRHRP